MGGRRLEVTAFHTIARWVFALQIRTLSHYRRKPPACLPVTVYKAGSTLPPAHHAPALPPSIACRLCAASLYRTVVPAAEFVSPCPHLKTTSAALGDGAAPANANGRRPRPRADVAHFENNWRGTGTHLAGSHFSRLPLHARNSCDSEALRSTREFLAQMIGEPPPARAPAQGRSRPGSPTRRRSRASICQFCLPMKCARIILHFG